MGKELGDRQILQQKMRESKTMKDAPPKSDISPEHSQIIEMAWCDETSFDAIYAQTGC